MKSYYATSVQSAMEEARRELGGDAILVTSRLAPAEAGKPRQYEVVFASENAAEKTPAVSRETSALESAGSIGSVLKEIREIRVLLDSLKQVNRPPADEVRWLAEPAAKQLFTQLTSAEVDPDLAQQLLAAAIKRAAQKPETGGRFFEVLKAASANLTTPATDLRAAAIAEIREVFRVDSGFSNTTIASLIGPPGAGKTATIAKLAVRYGLKLRRPTVLISTDTQRVAAAEQLRGYASVLGFRFELVQSARALGQILEDVRGTGLILIDTPGLSSHELNTGNEFVRFLSGRTDIQKHLVLPAPARCADTSRLSSAYDVFCPSHVIFSRMDETTVFGPVLSEVMGSGRPVSFFGTGQRVPEDLEEANAETLIGHLLPVSAVQQRMAAAA